MTQTAALAVALMALLTATGLSLLALGRRLTKTTGGQNP